MKLYQKIILNGTLECVTGLHIGASKESVEIGGVDLPVIRRKDNGQPYIPGSSLKGKIRCLSEQAKGENAENKFINTGSPICLLFGALENDGKIKKFSREITQLKKQKDEGNITEEHFETERKKLESKIDQFQSCQSRLIVRDAFLTSEWAKKLAEAESTDMPYTEIKWENSINRIKGTADSPRQIERIPAGAVFNVQFIINVFAITQEEADKTSEQHLNTLNAGVALINYDYLGGHGSRGYGQIDLKLNDPQIKKASEFYQSQTSIIPN